MRSFTVKFSLALAAGVIVAVVISPLAAAVVAALGLRFPFTRIFDRTVMVTVIIAMGAAARGMGVLERLERGFRRPVANIPRVTRGFLLAIAAIAALVMTAATLGARAGMGSSEIWREIGKYVVVAAVIAVFEEGFFRAFLTSGMIDDYGRPTGIVLSSLIYALAHVVRSPARFFLTNLDLTAGMRTLAMSAERLGNPDIIPTLLGLFLIGLVLAEAFVLTGTVYLSIGLHAGFVVGAKMWPHLTGAGQQIPSWLGGWGSQPLVSGLAVWIVAVVMLAVVRWLAPTRT
ncbi:MAG TPA: CPBP family intramembrane glutamic endopeptidase [Candidatus Binataceae bacterium]|nr:CPBP family intramembrane glutamic endopeptidase [Candidatus Binataceae bacterium]